MSHMMKPKGKNSLHENPAVGQYIHVKSVNKQLRNSMLGLYDLNLVQCM